MAVVIKIKRKTLEVLATEVLQDGEPAYSTNTGNVYVGDGVTLGGNIIHAHVGWEYDGDGDVQPM